MNLTTKGRTIDYETGLLHGFALGVIFSAVTVGIVFSVLISVS